ncbi:MAG: 50S ribosomal protein L4 [Tenericutes bacterium HGW-Tenericutes-1]|jgi:large subunit ribosomal protein L4|nr:MAG: 50S ribosomal protein L4 [Tenericutes bacterium HGW-Tenericutes-1]
MPKLTLLNQAGQAVGEITLSDAVYGVEPNQQVIYDVVKAQRAAMRQGTNSTKTKAEVSGTNKKPFRQKGTGHARQGSLRNPHYVGGGIAFGPKPRSYDYKVNKKIRRLALKIVLSDKVRTNEFIVLDNLFLETFKTKGLVEVLKNLNVTGKVMFLLESVNENLDTASRNMPNIVAQTTEHASVYDIMNQNFVVTTEVAAKKLEEVLLG